MSVVENCQGYTWGLAFVYNEWYQNICALLVSHLLAVLKQSCNLCPLKNFHNPLAIPTLVEHYKKEGLSIDKYHSEIIFNIIMYSLFQRYN